MKLNKIVTEHGLIMEDPSEFNFFNIDHIYNYRYDLSKNSENN